MKSISLKINLVLIIIILLMLTSMFSSGNNYDPGSATDPIVTQSYVESRLEALSASIDDKLKENTGASLQFDVVQVFEGQTIHLEANSQFILRAGEATAIAGQGGGLSDLTIGVDLATGESIVKNHYLLVPKSDGRGVFMKTMGWVMISGGYTVE